MKRFTVYYKNDNHGERYVKVLARDREEAKKAAAEELKTLEFVIFRIDEGWPVDDG